MVIVLGELNEAILFVELTIDGRFSGKLIQFWNNPIETAYLVMNTVFELFMDEDTEGVEAVSERSQV